MYLSNILIATYNNNKTQQKKKQQIIIFSLNISFLCHSLNINNLLARVEEFTTSNATHLCEVINQNKLD